MDREARLRLLRNAIRVSPEDLERELDSSEQPTMVVSAGHTRESTPEEKETPLVHAWALVQAYPSHESLWLYLRCALRPPFSPSALQLGSATSDRVRDGGRALAERFLSDGSADRGASVLPREHALARRHAARFLAWMLWQVRGDAAMMTLGALMACRDTGG